MTTPRHIIFGTGAIGLATFAALRRRGETVRLVNRSGHARVPGDVEVVGGDASGGHRFTRAAHPKSGCCDRKNSGLNLSRSHRCAPDALWT